MGANLSKDLSAVTTADVSPLNYVQVQILELLLLLHFLDSGYSDKNF